MRAPTVFVVLFTLVSPAAHAADDERAALLAATRADLDAARAALAEGRAPEVRALVRAARERLPPGPPADDETAELLFQLGHAAWSAGDVETGGALWEDVLAHYAATRPPDDPDLLQVRQNVAVTKKQGGDLEAALALEREVVARRRAALPEDDPALLAARRNLSVTLRELGRLDEALREAEEVLRLRRLTLPPDDRNLLATALHVGTLLRERGEVDRALALQVEAAEGLRAKFGEHHPETQVALVDLATTRQELGDLAGARHVFERALAFFSGFLPAEHEWLVATRMNLAATVSRMGDDEAARLHFERVLAVWEGVLPDDSVDLQKVRGNLAATLHALGEREAARALEERVLAAFEARFDADHPFVRSARQNLALSLANAGEAARARTLQEELLAWADEHRPPGHPDRVDIRRDLSSTLVALGEFERARALDDEVLDAVGATLPLDHPERRTTLANSVWLLAFLGDEEALTDRLRELARAGHAGVRAARAWSTRGAGALLDDLSVVSAALVSLGPPPGEDPTFDAALFALVESARAAASDPARSGDVDPAVDAAIAEVRAARRAVQDLVYESGVADAAALGDAILRRDAAETALRRRLAATGRVAPDVTVARVAAALPEHAAAVGYHVASRRTPTGDGRFAFVEEPTLVARVVTADGALRRLDLGPADAVLAAVLAWRRSVAPGGGRGVGVSVVPPDDAPTDAGERLRRLVLDPVLSAAPDASTLHVCVDGPLHVAALGVLPDGDGTVDDRVRLVRRVSFARLLEAPPPVAGEGSLLLVGDVDFDAGPAGSAAPPPFVALPGTAREVDALVTLFETTVGGEAVVLTGAAADRDAVRSAMTAARDVHLATHGWFAEGGRGDTSAVVGRMSPLALSGLALAGYNRGRTALGGFPGLLTAEEVAGIDLTGCRLVVLSACETGLGVVELGRGVASLRTAVHRAGARAALTSLWNVPDDETVRFMEEFWRGVWADGLPPAEALRRTRRATRERGDPPRVWAGWVLTGAAR